MGQMIKANNMVRQLPAVMKLGYVNEICTEKTGVLTQNCFSVFSAYLEGEIMDGQVNSRLMTLSSAEDIQTAIISTCTGGTPTEVGMLDYLAKSGAPLELKI